MATPGYPPYPPQAPAPRSRGLAIASLVLGILALPALLACGLGVLLGVVGLILGLVALFKGGGRGMAIAGVVLSMLALVVGALVIVWLVATVAECADTARYPTEGSQERCIDRELPFDTNP